MPQSSAWGHSQVRTMLCGVAVCQTPSCGTSDPALLLRNVTLLLASPGTPYS